MIPFQFQLTVNGEQHQVDQDLFKSCLVDCPREVAQRQIELGYGAVAVTNVFHRVLVPISVDVHKYIFVRTPTQAWKVAEVDVLIGKKEFTTDLFSVTDQKDIEISKLKAELAALASTPVEELKDEQDVPDDVDPDTLDCDEDPDCEYTAEELLALGHNGLVNLIVEEDETLDPEELTKLNDAELVQIYNDLWDEEFEKEEKTPVKKGKK